MTVGDELTQDVSITDLITVSVMSLIRLEQKKYEAIYKVDGSESL